MIEMKEEDQVFAGARMPKGLEKETRILAAKLGISRSEFFRLALQEFIKKTEKDLESESQRESNGKRS